MQQARRRNLMALGVIMLSGCAGLAPETLEEPSVMLDSFRVAPSEGLSPRFLIGLRIINPNRGAINIRGLTYDISLEDRKLLTGVASNLGRVPGYGESEIELQAGLDLLSGLRLFNDLLADPRRERVKYTFRARLDVGGLTRMLTLEEEGELTLMPGARQPSSSQ